MRKHYLNVCGFLCALLFLGTVTTVAYAEVKENLRYSYYSFQAGEEGSSLRQRVIQASPFAVLPSRNNKIPVGVTKSQLSYRCSFKKSYSGTCSVSTCEVLLDLEVVLPKMIGGTDEQRAQFDAFLSPLEDHEMQHVSIAREYAIQMEDYLNTVLEAADCDTLKDDIDITAKEIAAASKLAQQSFDDQEDHGIELE